MGEYYIEYGQLQPTEYYCKHYKSLAETYPALLDPADWKQHVDPCSCNAVYELYVYSSMLSISSKLHVE